MKTEPFNGHMLIIVSNIKCANGLASWGLPAES